MYVRVFIDVGFQTNILASFMVICRNIGLALSKIYPSNE